MADEEQLNNPVSRLHDFLRKAKSQPDPIQPARLWAKVFDVELSETNNFDPKELSMILDRLIDFQALISDAEKGLKELPDPEKRFLEPFAPIRKAVHSSLLTMAGNVAGITNPISERHMTLLELAAVEWSKKRPEKRIDEQELENVLNETIELFNLVHGATDIDKQLQKVILSMLSTIVQAIQRYRIVGPSSLEKAIVEILGQRYWNEEILQTKAPEGSAGREALKKVGAIFATLITVFSYANTTQKFIENFAPAATYITAGEPEIPPVEIPATNPIDVPANTAE